jgi:hypothetical protein
MTDFARKRISLAAAGAFVVAPFCISVAIVLLAEKSRLAHGTVALSWSVLIAICLSVINSVGYFAWFSRWNFYAHLNLAFSIVAYFIPILSTDVFIRYNDVTYLYLEQVLVGATASVVGALAARIVPIQNGLLTWPLKEWAIPAFAVTLSRRVTWWTSMCVIGVLASFLVLGYIPALASDPIAAKFFRGTYGHNYQLVAPIYRASTSFLAMLVPFLAFFAWRFRTFRWIALLTSVSAVMLAGLTRQPAVMGILVFATVLIAGWKRRPIRILVALVVIYGAGAALYVLLGLLGLSNFTGDRSPNFFQSVSSGAPDVSDQLFFLRSWLDHGQYTHGMTFLGGLVFGNYRWNPAVWTLSVINPGVDIHTLSSGGLRLPPPIWGYVSFGWPGLILVSALSGLATGIICAWLGQVAKTGDLNRNVCGSVLAMALFGTVSVFYQLGYLAVLQLLFTIWILRPIRPGTQLDVTFPVDVGLVAAQGGSPFVGSRRRRDEPLLHRRAAPGHTHTFVRGRSPADDSRPPEG